VPGPTPDQLGRLAELLAASGERVAGPLRATQLAGGRSNLTYRVDDDSSAWVLRTPPARGVVGSAHDVLREHRVLEGLHGTVVPVARPVVTDPEGMVLGVPASVVEFVPGRTVRSATELAALAPDELDRCVTGLVDTLAALHQVDVDAAGLADLGRPGGHAERLLRRWSTQWERMGGTDPRATVLHAALARARPDQGSVSVVHGDFRIDNVLFDGADAGRVAAVVDWELSTLGDPVADVAMMCAYRHPALSLILGVDAAWASPALPSVPELRDRYEARVGHRLPGFAFHLALAHYKLAVIAEGIAYRQRLDATVEDGGSRSDGDERPAPGRDSVGDAVPLLLEAGLEVLRGESQVEVGRTGGP
jgi:aminoglycoside phosphotransferase (APT) family kinase protein